MADLLVIEDNPTMREGIVQILDRAGHTVRAASNGKEGIKLFRDSTPEFVITDLKMDDMDGLAVLDKIHELSPQTLVMIITAFGTIETAVDAMKHRAFDFITKPFPPDLLRMKVNQALEVAKTRAENQFLRTENRKRFPDAMIGSSKTLRSIQEQLQRIGPTDSSVLITGESGTGKELVARAIHQNSPRANKPFIKVDCAALAPGVLESELFGHEKGAFTGAVQRNTGRFELAEGGTIFLDEIGEIPNAVQLRLLRVLQDRCFERVGGTRTIKVDVRVVSATNKDLQNEIQAGKFREDLYYRLHIIPIEMPPLRERTEDIPHLVEHFCQIQAKRSGSTKRVTPAALEQLQKYQWPGNIRELENLIERIFILTPTAEIDVPQLPASLKKSNNYVNLELPAENIPLTEALEELEKRLILRAFEECDGVKTKTAEQLGIKTSALYYKLEKYGIRGSNDS